MRYLRALSSAKADFLEFEVIKGGKERKLKVSRAILNSASLFVKPDHERVDLWRKEGKRLTELTAKRKGSVNHEAEGPVAKIRSQAKAKLRDRVQY
jgi:hypothetical protein